MDVLLFGVCDELRARKDGMTLNLIDSRDKASLLDQGFQVLVREVRDTYGAHLALGKLVDSFPCFAVGD